MHVMKTSWDAYSITVMSPVKKVVFKSLNVEVILFMIIY